MDIKVFNDISYGMYVVSSKNDKNVGCFINTLVQITSNNPMVSISVNKDNYIDLLSSRADGFLLGGVSLKVDDYIEIVKGCK